jgi:hypothetical protein
MGLIEKFQICFARSHASGDLPQMPERHDLDVLLISRRLFDMIDD